MTPRGYFIAACSVVGLCLPPFLTPAQAQCVEFSNPSELFAMSDAVFVGKVVKVEPTGIEGTHVTVSIGSFLVQKSWKGSVGRQVRVGSDVPFEEGKTYVVFASGAPLGTSVMCRSTELLNLATRKLKWLSGRPSHTVADLR